MKQYFNFQNFNKDTRERYTIKQNRFYKAFYNTEGRNRIKDDVINIEGLIPCH